MVNTNNSRTPSLTFRSFFSGGGIADIGAINAGFTPVSALEYNPNPEYGSSDCIAEWYRKNICDHCICEDILTVDRSQFGNCDLMHFSPTCVNFSVAKTGGAELQVDKNMATAIADIVESALPRAVTVENVRAYQKSESFEIIVKKLTALGYQYHYAVYDSADFGVPQNRKRLILRAVLNGAVPPLIPTHCDPKKLSKAKLQGDPSYEGLLPWNGWYAAIEDLLPGLENSQFAPWQLARLPSELRTLLVGVQGGGATARYEYTPSPTITSGHVAGKYRALLIENVNTIREATIIREQHPSPTVTVGNAGRRLANMPNAFLCSGTDATLRELSKPAVTVTASLGNGTIADRVFLVENQQGCRDATVRDGRNPVFTINTGNAGIPSHMPVAVVMDGQSNHYGETVTVKNAGEPMITVSETCNKKMPRAFHIDGQTGSGGTKIPIISADEPETTVTSSDGPKGARVYENGRIIKLSTRCLARFQSVPDWYELPTKRALAGRLIGNGLPALLYQRIAESLLPALR